MCAIRSNFDTGEPHPGICASKVPFSRTSSVRTVSKTEAGAQVPLLAAEKHLVLHSVDELSGQLHCFSKAAPPKVRTTMLPVGCFAALFA